MSDREIEEILALVADRESAYLASLHLAAVEEINRGRTLEGVRLA